MCDIAVIFDTNSYRTLVRGKNTDAVLTQIAKIRELEESKNIKAMCSVFTGYELLPYLSNIVESQSYKECFNSIIALGNHCWDNTTNPVGIISIPQTSLLVTNTFFSGARNTETETLNTNLIGLIQKVKLEGEITVNQHKSIFKKISQDIPVKEKDFADRIAFLISAVQQVVLYTNRTNNKRLIRKRTIDALNSEEFRIVMAKALLAIYASTVNINLTENELIKVAIILNEKFPIIAGFHTWVCHEVYKKDINLQSKSSKKERWNWLWDAEIASVISESTIGGRETWLITGDKPLTEVLMKHGYENRVMTLEKYLSYIEH